MNSSPAVNRQRKQGFCLCVVIFATVCLLLTNAWIYSLPLTDHASQKRIHTCFGGGSSLQQQQQRIIGVSANKKKKQQRNFLSRLTAKEDSEESNEPANKDEEKTKKRPRRSSSYDLGLGKNKPVFVESSGTSTNNNQDEAVKHWIAPDPVDKAVKTEIPPSSRPPPFQTAAAAAAASSSSKPVTTRRMVAKNDESQQMRKALWHEEHYSNTDDDDDEAANGDSSANGGVYGGPPQPAVLYPDLDLSIGDTVYCEDRNIDIVWDTLRWEAYREAQREPLLVSFLHSTILNHPSLESSLAFLLANRLSSPMMISTQLQSLILNALESNAEFRRALRADMFAVRDRDPACTCLPDVFLYFKGFQALQAHRVAHVMWNQGKRVLSHYLQSQVSQIFQIDIHPNATLKSGIMLDHGTGIVIGETATIGYNCSILHHVTLGGSGKKGVDRHPKVHDGVLLGAGATVLGNVQIGEGCQIGAGTLVISDLQPHCVAVGVPAKIIGSFVDVTEQPSIGMDQMLIGDGGERILFQSQGI